MINNLPDELKKYPHWCISTPGDKAPKLETEKGLYNASSTQGPWLSFDDAVLLAKKHHGVVGFVLTKNDPFVCIDLDIKDPETVDKKTGEFISNSECSTDDDLDLFQRIISQFNSYTELSASGKGVHIITKGVISHGVRRSGVEVYPHERYIICTGHSASNLYFDMSTGVCITEVISDTVLEIENRQELIGKLVSEMGSVSTGTSRVDLVELDPVVSDAEIIKMASKARNDVKFKDLFTGNYKKYKNEFRGVEKPKFPSQSEADYALMSMLCFYSKSNEQVRRIFRTSELGKRAKAMKNDRYLDLNLVGIRATENEVAKIRIDLEEQSKAIMGKKPPPVVINEKPPEVKQALIESVQDWPPGLTGEIAKFIFHSAPRPVREIAIGTAISIMAGFIGKAYNIPQSGLNLYTVIVARSGVGKEAMFSGTDLLLDRLQMGFARVSNHIDQAKYVSASALIKGCAEKTSFLNIIGEIGRTFKRLANDEKDLQIQEYRTTLLNLYQKSGKSARGPSLRYSSKDNDVDGASGVAYSLLGETNPTTFYSSITESMMSDGFLSRFLIIEYEGDRPEPNENPVLIPSNELCQRIYTLLTHVATLNETDQIILVDQSPEVVIQSDKFSQHCDDRIRSSEDESYRQMYNRAHLKVLRVSAQFAVGRNHLHPVVNITDWNYALNIVEADINRMSKKLKEGHIGTGDSPRSLRLLALIKDYVESKPPAGYKINAKLYSDGIIPRKYLQSRCARVSSFYSHRNGSNYALNSSLMALVEDGHLVEMNKIDVDNLYGVGVGKCYRILNL